MSRVSCPPSSAPFLPAARVLASRPGHEREGAVEDLRDHGGRRVEVAPHDLGGEAGKARVAAGGSGAHPRGYRSSRPDGGLAGAMEQRQGGPHGPRPSAPRGGGNVVVREERGRVRGGQGRYGGTRGAQPSGARARPQSRGCRQGCLPAARWCSGACFTRAITAPDSATAASNEVEGRRAMARR
jgi:hypothetical protein